MSFWKCDKDGTGTKDLAKFQLKLSSSNRVWLDEIILMVKKKLKKVKLKPIKEQLDGTSRWIFKKSWFKWKLYKSLIWNYFFQLR